MSRVGDMNERAQIQRLNRTPDGSGGFTNTTWVNVKEVWCKVSALSGRQLMEAQKLESTVTHVVRMRYQEELSGPNAELKHTMRLTFDAGSVVFAIHAVIPRGTEWEVMCSENARVS